MPKLSSYVMLASALFLSACATTPKGPSVMSLPGSGKSFDEFRYDDKDCRQYSNEQIGGTSANQAADESLAKSAVVGTAVGALIGAAAGGRGSAAIGAGTGLLVGSVEGTAAADASAYNTQNRYDNAYVQCMYAKGHRVPVSGHLLTEPRARVASPRDNYPPPPPPPDYAR